jgi:hypothetical protein
VIPIEPWVHGQVEEDPRHEHVLQPKSGWHWYLDGAPGTPGTVTEQ